MAASIALAATLHDATGALAGDLRRWLPALRRLYGAVAVATSPTTSPRIIAALRAADCFAGAPEANQRGPLYRLALRRAHRSGGDFVHYLDLDRALHWAPRARTLGTVLRSVRHDVVLIGRTERAHRSHHRPLFVTETEANRTLAAHAGLHGRVDFLVPSFIVSRQACATLLGRSRARSSAIYGEFAALLLGLAPEIGYVECAALDWETPDRARRAVGRIGLARWRRRWDTPDEWTFRYALATDVVSGFMRTLARRPARARLRRLA